MTAPDDQFSERLTDWEPRLAVDSHDHFGAPRVTAPALPHANRLCRIVAAAVIFITTVAWDWPSWMDKGPDWMPLSAEEVADAHSCSMDTMLAICAGKKRIATGIILAPKKVGLPLSSDAEVDHYRGPHTQASPSAYVVDAQVTIRQTANSGGPEWRADYYVLSSAQLDAIIAKARAEPEWKR